MSSLIVNSKISLGYFISDYQLNDRLHISLILNITLKAEIQFISTGLF